MNTLVSLRLIRQHDHRSHHNWSGEDIRANGQEIKEGVVASDRANEQIALLVDALGPTKLNNVLNERRLANNSSRDIDAEGQSRRDRCALCFADNSCDRVLAVGDGEKRERTA